MASQSSPSAPLIGQYHSWSGRIVYHALFPFLLLLGIGGALFALWSGVRPEIVAPVSYFSVVAIVAPLEWIFPFHASWNKPRAGDVWGDIGATLIIAMVFDGMFRAALLGILVAAGTWSSVHLGTRLWPSDWPFLVQCALGLVLAEFGMYWLHRAVHEIPYLWRFHSLHHHVPRLYWLNNGRFHPFDFAVVNVGSQVIVLALLGAPPFVLTIAAVAASICGMLAHANVDMSCGPLNWIVNTPQLHRWHHSTVEVETNTNYCSALVLWDIVFRTRHLPADQSPPEEVGTGNPRFPKSYLAQLLAPFRWSACGPQRKSVAQVHPPAPRLANYLVFPALLAANLAAVTWFGFVRGYDPAVVCPIAYFSSVSVLGVLERWLPYDRAWNKGMGDTLGDLTSVVFMATILDGLWRGVLIGLLGAAGIWLSAALGTGLWPVQIPLALQIVCAIAIADFGTYWMHRLSHEVPLLWRFHALHHHVPRLYWLNNGRFHPIDFAITNVGSQIVLLALLGAPPVVLTLVAFTSALLGLIAHCNIAMECGPLNWIVQSPQLHRWHHSTVPAEANSNYAFILPIFDLMFGTRYLPTDRAVPNELGTGIPDFPTRYRAQLIHALQRHDHPRS